MYHVAVGQSQAGPFDIVMLAKQAQTGEFNRATLVWKPGMVQWTRAGEVPELATLFANTPPPIPQ